MVINNRSQEELLGTVQEISEHQQNKLALQESEERLRLALDAAKLGIFDFDPSHNQIIWSQRLDEIFGFGPGEFGGRYEDFASRVYPEDLPRVDAELARSQTERNRFACEYRAVWPNGSTHWVSGLGEFSYDADGNVLRMRGVIWDITERKQMEETLLEAEALRQSEIKFRTLAEALPQIVWITKADGLTIYLNQHWVEYTGLTLEESYGHGWLIPFHPDDQKRTWEAWQNATKTDGVYSIESRLRRADGIYRWWLIRGVSLHDEKGNVVNWFGTCTDIQEIKGYEEKLQLAANVFLHSREGIVITDATATIVDVNAAFTSITGNHMRKP
jgi:PAS domain S-box-containing protein